MRRVCAGAAGRGVAVGAQVGYRDLAGFGRRRIDYDPDELRDDVLYQLAALDGFARVAGTRVRYVKPHGALYNTAAIDPVQAGAVVAAVTAYDARLPVLCQPGSVLASAAADAGLTVVGEGFADRGYRADGTLVPRSAAGALVHEPAAVVERAVRMATAGGGMGGGGVRGAAGGGVMPVDGTVVPCPVASICLHGDTRGAAERARRVRAALVEAGL